MKNRIVVFYHDDHDGIAGAAVIKYYIEKFMYKCLDYDRPIFVKCDYGNNHIKNLYKKYITLDNDDYYTVFIVDLSFTIDTVHILEELSNNVNVNLTWIDHHDSSINLINTYIHGKDIHYRTISKNHCGAYLAFEILLFNTDIEKSTHAIQALEYIDQYDRWDFDDTNNAKYFHLGLETELSNSISDIGKICKMEEILFKELVDLNDIIKNGKAIYCYLMNSYEFYRNKFGYESMIEGIRCYVINNKTNSWIFGDEIFNKYLICAVFAYDGEYYEYTLYSSNLNIDCLKIAEKFGGGGHKGAAGFRSKELVLKKIEE